MTIFKIETVVNPTNPRACWAVFDDCGRRIIGPDNLYGCLLERDRLVRQIRRGERRIMKR